MEHPPRIVVEFTLHYKPKDVPDEAQIDPNCIDKSISSGDTRTLVTYANYDKPDALPFNDLPLDETIYWYENVIPNISCKLGKLREENKSEDADFIRETWYYNGLIHRENDPAMSIMFIHRWAFQHKWYHHGMIQRSGEPALMSYDSSSNIDEVWYIDGVPGRAGDEPARIIHTPRNYNSTQCSWYVDGKLGRSNDKPAVVLTSGFGLTVSKWYIDGKVARIKDRPVEVSKYWGNTTQRWLIDGKLGRSGDKPSQIQKYGDTIIREWFIDGIAGRIEDRPAYVMKSKQESKETWYLDGLIGRADDKPAMITTTDDATISEWYIEGDHDRIGSKPVIVSVYTSGIIVEEWKFDWFNTENRSADQLLKATTHPNGDVIEERVIDNKLMLIEKPRQNAE